MEDEIIKSEFGSNYPMNHWHAELADKNGNPILCKCGNPAESTLISPEEIYSYCHECDPYEKYMNKIIRNQLNALLKLYGTNTYIELDEK